METGKAIYKLLKDSADVGAICADRIYPELAQQDADMPFIVYTVTDTTPSATKNATSKLDTARVELYCVSDDYETGMNLGIAVRSALDRVSGTISAVEVQSIDFDTSDIQFDPDQRVYVLEQTYDVRIQRTGTAQVVSQFPGNTFTVEEVDGDPSGAVNKLVFSNGSVSITDRTATITTGGVGVQYHGRYDTEAETLRSGATATLEVYYTARPDGDGYAESEVSDTGETDTINRTLFYSTKHRADPDTAGDWTQYTTQPADNASFATAKAALLVGLNETDATAETRGTLPLSLKMVRTTTAAATDLLLDTYTGAAAAYSVRKLSKDYTGNCMRVRRSSDESVQDIGFDSNGDLDTAAISTFVGDAYGYVSIWYDQSGNGNNAVQSTTSAQPMIYDRVAAAVVTENGKPALDYDGAQNVTLTTRIYDASMSVFCVWKCDSDAISNDDGIYSFSDTDRFAMQANRYAVNQLVTRHTGATSIGGTTTTTDQNLTSHLRTGSTATLHANGSALTTSVANANTGGGDNFIGQSGSAALSGYVWELVAYTGTTNGDQSSNRTGIENDIDTYFSIT
jgi:hypothetical protein